MIETEGWIILKKIHNNNFYTKKIPIGSSGKIKSFEVPQFAFCENLETEENLDFEME